MKEWPGIFENVEHFSFQLVCLYLNLTAFLCIGNLLLSKPFIVSNSCVENLVIHDTV